MISLSAPPRPSQQAESALIAAILDGSFPPGSTLPAERQLAVQLGVTRPPLREAIQRLARDGWLTVAQGKPTLVNNYWEEGGLNVLGKLAERRELPPDFVDQVLEIRLLLAPAYTEAAIRNASHEVSRKLAEQEQLDDAPTAFAVFDWQLHKLLTLRAGNPIYTLILNGFREMYVDVGALYFASEEARELSRRFYQDLKDAAARCDPLRAGQLCRQVMRRSIAVWARCSGDVERR